MQLIGMDPTSKNLREETEKWLAKLRKERPLVRISATGPLEKKAKEALRNMDAYVKDTSHFLEKGDYVRAFEAIVWAWGILEVLSSMHLIIIDKKG